MRNRTALAAVAGWACAALLLGCGGGSSTGGVASPSSAPAVEEEGQLVVRFDHDRDGLPDVLALDPSAEPFRIVKALLGTPSGDLVDRSAALAGQPIDAGISAAIAAYLDGSAELAAATELSAFDSAGNPVFVTIFE
ncbi:MAG: hypothetical protein KatS3mg102_1259 [Planctomycetota bacterium]|nr:MAG: hypothetical protein KatS3mg102_1259 [Planctomycetota bacterium]